MATAITVGVARVVTKNQIHISASPGPTVGKSSLADDFAGRIDQADLVSSTNRRASSSSLRLPFAAGPPRCASFPVLALSARLPPDLHHSQPAGGTRPPGAQVVPTGR